MFEIRAKIWHSTQIKCFKNQKDRVFLALLFRVLFIVIRFTVKKIKRFLTFVPMAHNNLPYHFQGKKWELGQTWNFLEKIVFDSEFDALSSYMGMWEQLANRWQTKNKKLIFWVFSKIWNCRQMSMECSILTFEKRKVSIFQGLSLGVYLMCFWFTVQKIHWFYDFWSENRFLGHNSSGFSKLQILRLYSCSASKITLYMLFSAKSETKRAKCQSLLDPYKKRILMVRLYFE